MAEEKKSRNSNRSKMTVKPLVVCLAVLGVLVALSVVGSFAIYLKIQSYLKSDAFQKQLVSTAEQKLHAQIDLEKIHWNGSTVFADGWKARGYEEASFSRMNMDGLRALFNGADNSAWQIPEIRANQLSVEFSPDRLTREMNSSQGQDGKNAQQPRIPGWLKKWIPSRAEIGVIRIDTTNLSVNNKQGEPTFSLDSVETTSRPMSSSSTWEIAGRKGNLELPNFPPMSVRDFETRWSGDEIFINQAAVNFHGNAELSGTGDMKLGKNSDLNLDLELSNLDTKKILSPNWADKISGTLQGEIFISGDPRKSGNLKTEGTLRLKDGVIEALPVLDVIARYTKMQRFKRLALHTANADFEKEGDRITITNLVLQSDGLTRLEGNLVLDGRTISKGEFQLGVTPGSLRWIPGAKQKVFTVSKGGLLWTPLVITGTLDKPQENLSARLAGAAVDTLVNDAPREAVDTTKKLLNNPNEAIDTGKKLLDSLVPLLKQ